MCDRCKDQECTNFLIESAIQYDGAPGSDKEFTEVLRTSFNAEAFADIRGDYPPAGHGYPNSGTG